ncbi:preflagellin peptidase FlaK [Methanomicrobium sp. W14]|uniref:A24 family peptidase C-terminal domain-containing protein n=1 Tax=Methanomicrobium sp. W14 TaxID=2817839 RepID=UPI001AE2E045|nr:A24 family peptidase C-terminal domain-containing protein [Methanomicrobium sp. W14]MBP2132836.1 preflagellin peptidase FlaK [Methanomicrobium sp. W14]
MIEPLLISSVAVIITLLYASVRDLRERRVPFKTWYPMVAVGIPMVIWTYTVLFMTGSGSIFGYIFLTALLCFMFYFSSAYLHLFGGADAWAFIFITMMIPLYPVEPLWGYPAIAFFPLTVLINAVVLNIVTPLGILLYNLYKGNKAPLFYMLVGFPVEGKNITDSFGFIMEDIEETDEGLKRRYISFSESLKRMISGKRRMYTGDLKNHPEEYEKEIRLYKRCKSVWISFGVPFIVPILFGFVTALVAGDILYEVFILISGVI